MATAIHQAGPKSDKVWRAAIQRAVHREYKGTGSDKWLDQLATKLVKVAHKGDVSALKEIGDRLDGKPAQSVDLGVQVQVTAIERRIVDAIDVDAEVVSLPPSEPAT